MIYRARVLTVSACVVLAACGVEKNAEMTDRAGLNCPDIKGISAVLDNPLPRVIILGELHGMEGPPAFAEALVCHSLARGKKTALGFEMSDDKDGRLAAYLTSNGNADAQIEVFKHNMWTHDFTDGRSSEAMLGLLDYARSTQQSASGFKPFLFQETNADWTKYKSDPKAVLHANEKGMADNIISFGKENKIDKTIVLVGNLHAKRGKNPFGANDYDFMAVHLPTPEAIALENFYGSGTSWNCVGSENGGTVCGESETQGNIDPDGELAKTGTYAITIPQPSDTPPKGYDGGFYVGSAKASKPANFEGRVASKP